MTYKNFFLFIAKCLTISLFEDNKHEIESILKKNIVDWDTIVKLSTSQYVLPALYCNFERSGFLKYLPDDLIAYMQYLTTINANRNTEIIKQAKRINNLLLEYSIRPIFLKGTGNLLAGLYENIAERMVGDIDFIVSTEDYPKAINILRNYGYYEVEKYKYYAPSYMHYRRLKNDNYIAAIEIHYELTLEKYKDEFNYSFVEKTSQNINNICVTSYANMLNLSIISDQINDGGFYYKTIALRNAYDVYLLSKKTNAKDAINILYNLKDILNCFLAASYEVFNKEECLKYDDSKKVSSYLASFNEQFKNKKIVKFRNKLISYFLFLKPRFYMLRKSFTDKDYRLWFFKRISDINWYKEKLSYLNFKKDTSSSKIKKK